MVFMCFKDCESTKCGAIVGIMENIMEKQMYAQ